MSGQNVRFRDQQYAYTVAGGNAPAQRDANVPAYPYQANGTVARPPGGGGVSYPGTRQRTSVESGQRASPPAEQMQRASPQFSFVPPGGVYKKRSRRKLLNALMMGFSVICLALSYYKFKNCGCAKGQIGASVATLEGSSGPRDPAPDVRSPAIDAGSVDVPAAKSRPQRPPPAAHSHGGDRTAEHRQEVPADVGREAPPARSDPVPPVAAADTLGLRRDLIEGRGIRPERFPSGEDILKEAYAKRLIVSPEAHVIYCPIPAVATSNWKYLLRKFAGFADYADLRVAHSPSESGLRFLNEFGASEIDAMLTNGSYVTFSFVRHPMHRLLSTYLNKFTKKEKSSDEYKVFMGMLYGWDWVETHDLSISDRPAFEDFLAKAAEQSGDIYHDHWASQKVLCGFGHFPYDYIGRLEAASEDSRTILDAIGRPNETFPTASELKFPVNGVEKQISSFYTKASKDLVTSSFADDFRMLAYSPQQ